MGTTILDIPDTHCHPQFDNARLHALGRAIVDWRPDIVRHDGDLADVTSFCSHSSPGDLENIRYMDDVRATIDGQEALWSPTRDLQAKQRRNKEKVYAPRRILTLGNHEARIEKLASQHPVLKGKISLEDFRFADYWDEIYDFLDPCVVEGVQFQHYFVSGVKQLPISGEHAAAQILAKTHLSAICGHTHTLDYAERGVPGTRQKIFAIVNGCFTHEDMQHAKWCKAASYLWSNGVTWLELDGEGYYLDIRRIQQRVIMREYL